MSLVLIPEPEMKVAVNHASLSRCCCSCFPRKTPNDRFEKTTSGSCWYENLDDRDRFERLLLSRSLRDEAGPSENSSHLWNPLNYCTCLHDRLQGQVVQEGQKSGHYEVHQLVDFPFFEDP